MSESVSVCVCVCVMLLASLLFTNFDFVGEAGILHFKLLVVPRNDTVARQITVNAERTNLLFQRITQLLSRLRHNDNLFTNMQMSNHLEVAHASTQGNTLDQFPNLFMNVNLWQLITDATVPTCCKIFIVH